jgi:hypothetical protein
MLKLILEMLAYWTLAAIAAFLIGGVMGWLSLGTLDRKAAGDLAWTVCGIVFAAFALIGRPMSERPAKWLR